MPLFPFHLLNYGFGLTRVRFRTYVFWSWLCMLPSTILYVVGGDAIAIGVRERRVPWVLVGIVAVGLVMLTAVGYVVKRKIRGGGAEDALEDDPPLPDAGGGHPQGRRRVHPGAPDAAGQEGARPVPGLAAVTR